MVLSYFFYKYLVTLVVCAFSVLGKYNNWDKVDPAELFSKAPTEKKEANPKLSMVKFLQVSSPLFPSQKPLFETLKFQLYQKYQHFDNIGQGDSFIINIIMKKINVFHFKLSL